MSFGPSLTVLALFLQLLFQWQASCSGQPFTFKSLKSLALTEESMAHFTPFLKDGSSAPPIVQAECWFIRWKLYRFCLKYLICSIVISGEADKCILQTIYELFADTEIECLVGLLHDLTRKNDFDTMVQFAAENMDSNLTTRVSCRKLIVELMAENWGAMEKLVMGIMAMLKDNAARRAEYHYVLRHLPVEKQYEMISSGEVPADTIDSIYSFDRDYLTLREMFFLASCSCSPNLEIRSLIAEKYPYFIQFLAETITEDSKAKCPDCVPASDTDSWHSVSKFVNVEEMIFVWPLVCKSWRKLCSTILQYDTRVHDRYLLDLNSVRLCHIHAVVAPWKNCLRSREKALGYLQRCIEHGVLDRITPGPLLQGNLRRYLKAIINNEAPLPVISGCATQLDTFLYLFRKIYGLCADKRPVLSKPKFLTNQEYEEAVRYFVFKKGWMLRISESLMIEMPKLFDDIKKDAELVKELTLHNYRNFLGSCLVLLLCGREDRIPEELALLVLPEALDPPIFSEQTLSAQDYYDRITEYETVCLMIIEHCNRARVYKLMFFIVLSLKDSPDEIEKLVQSIARHISEASECGQATMKALFGSARIFADEDVHPPEDVKFFKEVAQRCGLLEDFRVIQ